MSKKKVTAPLTYNPGKGRPKEYLAYLNYQEMQALKRLNGNNQERGPRGLPSFPPAGAMSGGSAKSPASTSKEAGAGSRPSSGGPRSGERGSVSPSSGSPRGSNPPGAGGSDSGSRQSGGSRPSGGMMGGTGAGGSSRTTPSRASSDREAIDAANKANSSIAKTTPALKSDLSRSVSAKPMGASVGVNFPTGGRISGAIKSLQAPAAPVNQDVSRKVTIPAATISTNQSLSPSAARIAMGDVAPTPSIYKTVAEADRAIVAKATQTYNQRFGTNYTPDQFSRLAKTVAGEAAGESDFGRAAVANTFGNRAALAQQEGSPYGYMGGGDFASLADQYDAYRVQNAPYRAAVPGTKTYQQGVNAMYQTMNPQSTFSRTASPKVLTSTHYYNPAEVRREPDWAMDKTKFERIGSHLFGTAEASPSTVAKARAAQLANADASIVPTSFTPEESGVPTPRSRPPSQNMQRPPSAGRSIVVPTTSAQEAAKLRGLMESYQQPPGYGKQFVDRVPTYDGGPPKSFKMSTEIQGPVRPAKLYTDRIKPESQYSGYGTTGYSTLSGIPTPDSVGLLPSDSSYKGVFGLAKSGVNALTGGLKTLSMPETYKMPEAAAEGLRNWGLAKGIETPKNLYEEAMSLYSDPQADADLIKAATPFAESLRNKFVSGVSGLQESYKNALSNRAASEDDMPSVDTSTTKISVGPKLGTIDKIVEDQKNLTKQEKDELKQILSEAASRSNVEWSTDEFNATINEAKRNLASGENPSSPKAQPAPKGGYPLTSMGTAPEVISPDIFVPLEQRKKYEKRLKNAERGIKGTGAVASALTGIPGGRKLGGVLSETYNASVKEKLDNYVLSTPEQRAEMERKDPSLTAWADIIGETPQLDRRNYTDWAEKSGLRVAPDRRGGGENPEIRSLTRKPKGDETTTPEPDTPSTTPGRRPDIYYMWDLGINIPSPSDPNYNQYQTYLAERLAAQRAMGYV